MRARSVIVVCMTLILTGCAPKAAKNSICNPVPSQTESSRTRYDLPPTTDPNYRAVRATKAGDFADACLQRWSYRLASGPDPAPVVAAAVSAVCSTPVRESAYASHAAWAPDQDFDTSVRETVEEKRQLALFYVVQGRAGRCRAP